MNWIRRSKRRIVRRIVQLFVLFLLVSPVLGLDIFRGTLLSGTLFGITFNDPLAALDYILAAKTILATSLAFAQAMLLLLAVNALGRDILLVISIVILASLMVAGLAMITGSAGRDFMGTLIYGMIFMLLMTIPAFAALFPGSASPWIKALPSYGIVEGLVGTTIYGHGWNETAPYLALIAAWDAIILGSGMLVLKKKVETL